MYENFAFEERDRAVVGYHFPCSEPKAVMCIIHGIGEHAGRYQRMADKLAARKIAVVSMDHRGHGISKGVRGDTAPRCEVLKDVDALITHAKALYPDIPLILYGHSMGGNICLDYRGRGELNHVPDKYIVSSPWIKLVMQVPKPLYHVIKAASKLAPKKTIAQKIKEEDLGNLENVRPYLKDPLVHNRITLRCAAEGFDIGNAIYDGKNEDNGRAEGKPFLLMYGDEDKICDPRGSRRLAERMDGTPGFTAVEWKGYCHEIHNGGGQNTGDEVIERIGDFVLE